MIKHDAYGRAVLRLALAISFLFGACWSASAQQPASEEYRIYEAVLNQINAFPTRDPHVVIYDRTLNSKCDAASNNPVFANGCSFLWVKPDTDQEVEQMLRKRFHGLEHSTWKNFKANNEVSVTLHDPISTPWKHRFFGSSTRVDASQEWSSPDMTIYLSRVGFNSKKTEAVVYVLAFSYAGRLSATGDYLRFRLGRGGVWSLAGRVRYMVRDDDKFVSVPQPDRSAPERRAVCEAELGEQQIVNAQQYAAEFN